MPEGLCWWGNPHSLLVGLQSDEASIKTSIDNSQNRLKSYRDNCSAVFISGKNFMSLNWLIKNEIMAYIHYRILFSCK